MGASLSSPATNPAEAGGAARPARRRYGKHRLAKLVLLTVAISYLAVCAAAILFQKKLIYFPSPRYGMTPAEARLAFEGVTLTAEDGVKLAAWHIPQPDAKATVLVCHGNGDNIGDLVLMARTLHRLGYSVLLFDYRGYGGSAGSPDEQGLYRDAEAAWCYLVDQRGEPPARIVILGRSLGAAVAIELAARHPPAALVTECAFTSLVDIGQREYPLLPVSLLCTQRFDAIEKVPRVTCPKLFFHGRGDEIIPLENGRRLFAAACEPKQFIETPGGHNESGFEYGDEYTRKMAEWLEGVLSGAGESKPR